MHSSQIVPVIVRDIVVVVPDPAIRGGAIGEYYPIIDNENSNLDELDRLYSHIKTLIEHASLVHKKENCDENILRELNHVTRLITNEFSFYTSKPLSMEDFTWLMSKIFHVAEKQPLNLHLVLASFAILLKDENIEDDMLMNVVVYIECGLKPEVRLIVKNKPHNDDPDYNHKPECIKLGKGKDTSYVFKSNEFGNKLSISSLEHLPKLIINDKPYAFSFSNHFVCRTAGKQNVTIGIEICYDHYKGLFRKKFLEQMNKMACDALSSNPDQDKVPNQYSHCIVSKTVYIENTSLLGNYVQADPNLFISGVSKKRKQTCLPPIKPLFGHPFIMIDAEPIACDTQSHDNYCNALLEICNKHMSFENTLERLKEIRRLLSQKSCSNLMFGYLLFFDNALKEAKEEIMNDPTLKQRWYENLKNLEDLEICLNKLKLPASKYDYYLKNVMKEIKSFKKIMIEINSKTQEENKSINLRY